jgi:hypothetical protein
MSRRAAVFAAWRGALRGDVPGASDGVGVRLLGQPARPPATPVERLLVDTLNAQGPLSWPALVATLSRSLYRDELARAGWLAALGFFNENLFAAEVTRALDATRGVLWEFDPATIGG